MALRSATALVVSILLVSAAPAAQAAPKSVEASRVFPFLEDYLKLPAAERNRFTPAYYLHQGDQPLVAPAWLIDGAQRTPIPIRADGRIEVLPSAQALARDKVEIGVPAGTKLGVSMSIEPTLAPAADMDARELAAVIAQAAVGARKAAGIKAVVMPKLTSISFVGSGSGEVEFNDGRRAPLPLAHGAPSYNPSITTNAKRIRLAKVPLKLNID